MVDSEDFRFVPVTAMDGLYRRAEARLRHDAASPYELGERADAQVALARADREDPGLVAAAFALSVEQFEREYAVPDAPFHDEREPLGSEWLTKPMQSTHAVAARMREYGGRPSAGLPPFSYLDREIAPGRTPGGVMAVIGSDGASRSARSAPRIDLLLVRSDIGAPVVCEVKCKGDQNAYYALIQSLALAAQLAPAGQRKRMNAQYATVGEAPDVRLEVWIALVDHKDSGDQKAELYQIAKELAPALMTYSWVNTWVGAIRCARVSEDPQGPLSFEQVWSAA